MNVTLIGMAGAGKTYIGKRLSKRLSLRMLDVDTDLWEARYGKGIQQILDELGEEKYVAEEERLILEATDGENDLLISPPGSVAYQKKALDHLRNISTVIYLRVPFKTIELRLEGKPARAIIGLGRKTLRELYEERHPVYESSAHFAIDTEGRDEVDVIDDILEVLESSGRSR